MKIIEQQQQQLVLEGNAYHNFVDTIKSKRTLDEYRHGIMRFMRFLQVTDVNNLILFDSKEAQQKIIVYWIFKARAENSSSYNQFVCGFCNALLRDERHNAKQKKDRPLYSRENKDK